MELSKHTIWENVRDADNFESFQKNILLLLYIKQNIPNDIKESVFLIEKLLKYSYFEYEFIDIALTQLIFIFEKALKTKWNEIHDQPTKSNLRDLIDWFDKQNYFETWNNEDLQKLRLIRNEKVHSEKKSLGGIAYLHIFYNIIDLINDLYEDVQLRIKRRSEIENLNIRFNSFIKEGVVLHFNNQKKLIFKIYPIFINNKIKPEILNLYLCPLFNLNPYKKNKQIDNSNWIFSLSDWEFNDDIFSAKEINTGNILMLSKICNDKDNYRFQNWQNNFNHLPNYPMILYLITEPLNEFFIKNLREFHRYEYK